VGIARRCYTWAASTLQKSEISERTCIDLKQSYQVAYWKERFGISEEELIEAVHAAGERARNVEAYMRDRRIGR